MATKDVVVRLLAVTAAYQAQMAAASRSTAALGTTAQASTAKASTGLGRMGGAATIAGTALAGMAVTAGGMASDFETSFAKIQGLVGVSADEIGGMKDAVMRLSGETAKSPQELADALFFITSAGLEGAEAIDALEFAAKASAAGLGETAVIADALTSAMNAYADEGLTAAAATDVLVAAVREGKLEPDQLAGSLGKVIPIAAEMGVEFDEVAAAVAAMSRAGLNADEGTTALRGMLTGLLSPSKETESALSDMGLSIEDVQDSLENQGLLSTLRMLQTEVEAAGGDMSDIFPNVRALAGAMNLLGGDAEATADQFDAVKNSAGDTDKAFDVMADTSTFKLSQAFNDLKKDATELGGPLLDLAAILAEIGAFELPPLLGGGGNLSVGEFEGLPQHGEGSDFLGRLTGGLIGDAGKAKEEIEEVEVALVGLTEAQERRSAELLRQIRMDEAAAEKLAETSQASHETKRSLNELTTATGLGSRNAKQFAVELAASAEAEETFQRAIADANHELANQLRAAMDLRAALHEMANGVLDAEEAEIRLRQKVSDTNEALNDEETSADDARLALIDLTRDADHLAQQQVDLEGHTLETKAGMDTWNTSMLTSAGTMKGELRRELLNHIARVNDIPEEKVSEIEAILDKEGVDAAQIALDTAARDRGSKVNVTETGASTVEEQLNRVARNRTAQIDAFVTTHGSVNVRGRDAGGMGMAGDVVAERGPELVSGFGLATSPMFLPTPAPIVGRVDTAAKLDRLVAAVEGGMGASGGISIEQNIGVGDPNVLKSAAREVLSDALFMSRVA